MRRSRRALGPSSLRRLARRGLAFVALAAVALGPPAAEAAKRRPRLVVPPEPDRYPALRYAAMLPGACRAELTRRSVAYTDVPYAAGVLIPVRVPEGVGGVLYTTGVGEKQLATSAYDVFDCRLVLALHDFSAILRGFDIDEVRIYSAWRPPGRRPAAPAGRRHPAAMAVDLARFGLRGPAQERVWLDVLRDFHGTLGAPPCGEGAPLPVPFSDDAAKLRKIACAAADARIFNSILTPNYDYPHRNHFHVEVTPEVRWFIVR